MTHRIYQFGSVQLPPAMTEDDLGTGEAESTLVASVGAMYDAWGANRRLPRRQTINLRGMFEISDGGRFDDGPIRLDDHAGNNIVDHLGRYILVDYGELAMRRNLANLKGLLGTRQQLRRRREDDQVVTWKLARLIRLNYVRSIEDAGVVAHVETVFETAQAAWRANTISTFSANFTAVLAAGLSIGNNSQVPVNDAVLSITSTSTVTSLRVLGTGIDLIWVGSLTSGQTLTIDAGLQTIRIAGIDQYSGLTRGPGHTAAGWLPIPVGASVLTVTANSSGIATLDFYEQTI